MLKTIFNVKKITSTKIKKARNLSINYFKQDGVNQWRLAHKFSLRAKSYRKYLENTYFFIGKTIKSDMNDLFRSSETTYEKQIAIDFSYRLLYHIQK